MDIRGIKIIKAHTSEEFEIEINKFIDQLREKTRRSEHLKDQIISINPYFVDNATKQRECMITYGEY